MVFRMQSGRARVKGQWITLNPTGTPDLLAIDTKNGFKAIFIETKRPKDSETSLEQKRFQEAYSALGGTSMIVHSFDEFIQKLGIDMPVTIL